MSKASIAGRKKGRKLAQERADLGLSQGEFARQAHLSPRTIWSAEQGLQCRQFTKRRIMRALRQDWTERARFFVPPRRRL